MLLLFNFLYFVNRKKIDSKLIIAVLISLGLTIAWFFWDSQILPVGTDSNWRLSEIDGCLLTKFSSPNADVIEELSSEYEW